MPKKKNPPAPISEEVVVELSKEQEFYIKGNCEVLSETQIARDLRIPVGVVRDFLAQYQKDTRQSRTSSLMQRPAKGVVAMTEAAAMASDDFKRGGRITQDSINAAAAAGNYKLAAELAEKRETQEVNESSQQQARYSGCWHFIRPKPGS